MRSARAINFEAAEDETRPVAADTVQDEQTGSVPQRSPNLLENSLIAGPYTDRSTMVPNGRSQSFLQDAVYDAKPRQITEYAY